MQTKKQSFIESLTNTFIGFVISFMATFVIFPLLSIQTSLSDNLAITIFYTVISIIRSYVIRRYFNKKLITYPISAFTFFCIKCQSNQEAYTQNKKIHCNTCHSLIKST